MKLHWIVRRYTNLGGAEVQIRRFIFTVWWQCTGCPDWGNTGNPDSRANEHASQCRAQPRR